MRELTVKRRKSFVGCVMTLKVYIEDGEAGDMIICGVRCRKLGDLKNGEEKTFEVGEASARVFAICDAITKDYCNDLYILPEGEESVSISGVCKFNLFNGNAFRFDGAPCEEALRNRKKYRKYGTVIMIAAIIVGVITGTAVGLFIIPKLKAPSAKTFSSNGVSITLNTSFKEEKTENILFSVRSKSVWVFSSKDDFTSYPGLGEWTLDEYADLIAKTDKFENVSEVKHDNGLTYLTYDFTDKSSGNVLTYFTSFYKTDSAFWIVQFTTTKSAAEKYRPDIIKWAQTVKFE